MLDNLAISYYITARGQLATPPGQDGKEEALQRQVRAAFSAGVGYVQVREKDLPGRRLAQLVEDLQDSPEKKGSRLLVNERLDLAIACGADGVHLPADSLPLSAARSKAGREWIVGISCHTEEEVAEALREGASYVLWGPVFETPSKPGAAPLGLSDLARLCRRFAIPVFALGGVNVENAKDCVQAGAAGVAGIRLFQQASNLEEVCRYLHSL